MCLILPKFHNHVFYINFDLTFSLWRAGIVLRDLNRN